MLLFRLKLMSRKLMIFLFASMVIYIKYKEFPSLYFRVSWCGASGG